MRAEQANLHHGIPTFVAGAHERTVCQIIADQDFKDLFHAWRRESCPPVPTNPRLRDYAARRDTHFLKLAMVVCVDRGGPLVLTAEDFRTTMNWLLEAELPMGKIFIDGDTAAGVQAFLDGSIQVAGDLARLVAMQTVDPSEPQKRLTQQIAAITR